MDLTSIILVGIGFIALALIYLIKKIDSKKDIDRDEVQMIVNQVFGEVVGKVTEQTKNILAGDKEAIFKDNQNKKEVIEKLVNELKRDIENRQEEIRSLEKDRNKKFGEITTAIDEHRKITEQLKVTTDSLSRVLSNNQTRGGWGERIIEDILTSAGLIENIHYERQKALGKTTAVKPDITLLLPNQRKVAVDVKFPYSEIQKMAEADSKDLKAQHKNAFGRDLKTKIDQISDRGYIDIEHGTLDYAIMFVPNEMLFSFINQQFPEIVDEAMAKKVMIVSPFTFLIVARTVMESYRNFMMENNLRKIVKHISEFSDEWVRFRDEFNKMEGTIDKLHDQYNKITSTRYKRMNLRLKRIEDDQRGNKLSSKNQKLIE
jgi:DNA recombination protein RmuC